MLEAFLFHVDSSACDATSRPDETVVSKGTEIVNSDLKVRSWDKGQHLLLNISYWSHVPYGTK